MKKSILFFFFLSFFIVEVSAQKRAQNNKANEDKKMMMKPDRQTQSSGRNSRSLLYTYDGQVNQGHYVNIYHEKQYLHRGYKYEVELYVNQGNADLYIYGDGGNKRVIRYSNRSGSSKENSFYEYSDLRSNERSIAIGIYGYHSSRFTIKIYKVKAGGDCIDPSKIQNNALCSANYDPVCGCDGKTYANKCVAEIYNGVTSYTQGPCNNSNQCIDRSRINPNAVCTQQYDPVCGCDNKTYSNSCVAESKGVTKFTKGACGGNNTSQCTWKFWYDDCNNGKEIAAGSDYYVKVNTEKYQDIKWMDLYVNGRKVRREANHPYEWGRPNTSGDALLRNLQPGTYKLKCVVYDKCGKEHEEYCNFTVKHRQCNYGLRFTHGEHGKHYRKHSNLYVKVQADRHQDIEWCELYINGHKVRRETNAPYEWGPQHNSNDHRLKRMEPGTYKLRCYYKTKCGQYKEKFSTIHVDNH